MRLLKPLLIILFCIGICWFLKPKSNKSNKIDVIEHIQKATISILNDENKNITYSKCTGVWIAEDKILTAFHCLDHSEITSLISIDKFEKVKFAMYEDILDKSTKKVEIKKIRLASVFATAELSDLAILKVDKEFLDQEHEIAKIAKQNPKIGDHIAAVGHPIGYFWWSYFEGVVAAKRTFDSSLEVLQITSADYLGGSGGGAFNSNGEIIGIFTSVSNEAPTMTFFVTRDLISSFVNFYL